MCSSELFLIHATFLCTNKWLDLLRSLLILHLYKAMNFLKITNTCPFISDVLSLEKAIGMLFYLYWLDRQHSGKTLFFYLRQEYNKKQEI